MADLFPGSAHVIPLGLGGSDDREIWAKAAAGDDVIVMRDEDCIRLTVLLGPPPKVAWVRLGNCATRDVAKLLLAQYDGQPCLA